MSHCANWRCDLKFIELPQNLLQQRNEKPGQLNRVDYADNTKATRLCSFSSPSPALKHAESTKSGHARRSILKNRQPFCCFYPFLEFDAFHLIICVREEQNKTKQQKPLPGWQARSNHKWLQGSSTGIHLRLPRSAPFLALPCPAPCFAWLPVITRFDNFHGS